MKVKKYINLALIYSIVAMVFGVFYREFTKFSGFSGDTKLSVMHTHFFVLGMIMFLIFAILEHNFSFSKEKHGNTAIVLYNVGLIITGVMLFVRGYLEVLGNNVSRALDMSISGIAGIGHAVLGAGIILFFLALKKSLLVKSK